MWRCSVLLVLILLVIGCSNNTAPTPTAPTIPSKQGGTEVLATNTPATLPATPSPVSTVAPTQTASPTVSPGTDDASPTAQVALPLSPTEGATLEATSPDAPPAGGGETLAQLDTYQVRPGDTLSEIASAYGISVEALAAANDIVALDTIRVGQELVIPGPDVAAAQRQPAQTSATPTSSLLPTPRAIVSDDIFAGLTIPDMRARQYGTEGEVNVGRVLVDDPAFTRYYVTYPSDGLTISGMMNVPKGEGPFPVAIMNHGYIAPSRYWTGAGSHTAADYLARRGYLTISPDYRGYGTSDDGPDPFRKGYVIDVLNLVNLVNTIPQADPERIAMWGHSMGGGIAKEVMVINDKVDAFALYGAMSDDAAENWHHIRRMWNRSSMDRLAEEYGSPAEEPEGYARMSPRSYLENVTAPVIIHHGTADTQVPVEWSKRLAADLEALGKPVELYIYEGQPHSFQGDAWVTFMQRTKDFFDKHLGDG